MKHNNIKLRELIGMYSYHLGRFIEKGMLTETSNIKLKNDEMYDNYSSLVSAEYNMKMYHVTDLPREMSKSVTYFLKMGLGAGIKMDVVTQVQDYAIDWTTPYMKRIKEAWTKKIGDNNPRIRRGELNDPTVYEKSRQSNLALDSWNLIARKTVEGYRTVDEEMIVLLRYPRVMPLKEQINYETLWINGLKGQGIGIEIINSKVKEMFYSISPTRSQDSMPVKNYNTWLDENVALSESFIPGKIDGKQVFMGRDVSTNMFVYSDLLTTGGGAMNIIMLAKSGGGKSFYLKVMIPILACLGVNVITWDKDGEYTSLCNKLGYPTIALGKNGGYYFNTVPIMSESDDGFEDSMRDTMAIFDVLCNPDTGMTHNEKFIIESGYNQLLSSSGVSRQSKSSWKNANNLDYKDLYKQICRMSTITDDILSDYNNLKRKLSSYFEMSGAMCTIFVKPIDIENLLYLKKGGQPLIVNINMQTSDSKDHVSVSKSVDKIKSITMSSITDRLVSYSKQKGELTAVLVEEFQRHTTNKPFVKKVHAAVTGGRKENMIPILVTNSIDSLINGDDPLLQDIVKNINTLIIGAVTEEAAKDAIVHFDLDNCENILRRLRVSSESGNKTDPWLHGFLIRVKSERRTEMAVVRAHVPPEMRNSSLFKTRDEVNESK